MQAYGAGVLLVATAFVLFTVASRRARNLVQAQQLGKNVPTRGKEYSPTIVVPSLGPVYSGQLIFFEDFENLNLSIWKPVVSMSGCGSGEFQIYDHHDNNAFVKDGMLHIQPTLTVDRYGEQILVNGTLELPECNDPLYDGCKKTAGDGKFINPVISVRLKTLGSFAFAYGKVEVKAKVPRGNWLWPAIWLNPSTRYYGDWPKSGEIDIMESRGNDVLLDGNGNNVGNTWVGSALHFGTERSNDQWRKAHGNKFDDQGFYKDFHRYQLEWTQSSITLLVDDEIIADIVPPEDGGFYALGGFNGTNIWKEPYNNARMAPFDIPMYVILNVAVGGILGFFDDSYKSDPPKPWKNWQTMDDAMKNFWDRKDDWYPTWVNESAMIVDYVKIWAI